ncbi:MAG: hypothetical protein RR911_06270 [Oscillospiraceae bacterium]
MDKQKLIKYSFLAGKIGCIILYVVGIILGLKKKNWWLFGCVAAMHIAEAFLIGIKTGVANGRNKVTSAICTLLFGFTWWLPIKQGLIK